jgi:WG containing repeat
MKFWAIGAALFYTSLAAAADITAYHKEHFGKISYNKSGVAHIVTRDGWGAINKKKQILYKPFIFDNGPDYVQEGLLRYIEDGKMGFVDEAGKKMITAEYDFVSPFEGGVARFCNGCRAVEVGEHRQMDEKTGIWGRINKSGKKLP